MLDNHSNELDVTRLCDGQTMASEPEIEVRGDQSGRGLDELLLAVRSAHPQVARLAADQARVEMPPVRFIVSEDFVADVGALIGSEAGTTFTADRMGGTVAAKTLDDPDQLGRRLILLNGELLVGSTDARTLADQVFLVGHELTHVVQTEVRQRSGVMLGIPIPSETSQQRIRSMVRTAVDEYRADLVALLILGSTVSVTGDTGEGRPANVADTWALSHLVGAEDAILALHRTAPDLVYRYRIHALTLGELLHQLTSMTDQFLTLLAHYQGTCDSLGIEDPWALGKIPSAPATSLYVRPTWDPIAACARAQPLLPSVEELATTEPDLLEIGEQAVTDLWSTLGVSIEVLADGQEYAHVTDPQR
jgi:hypothetical protein